MEAQLDPKCDFYVYALLRADGVTPFYIGKGQNGRVSDHSRPAELAKRGPKSAVARKVIAEIGHLPHEIIHSGLTEAQSFVLEADLIAMLGRRNLKTGILVNLTDGGDGASGHRHSPETLARMTRNIAAAFATEETRERHRKAVIAARACPKYRERMSETKKAEYATPEARLKIARTVKSALATPEGRAKRSEQQKRRFSTPEARAAHAASARKRWEDPEARVRQSEAVRVGKAKARSAKEAAVAL